MIMKLFYRLMLAWTRLDLLIARSAPVMNMPLLEQLRRDEDEWDRSLLKLEINR